MLLCFQFRDLEEIKYRPVFQKNWLQNVEQFN